MAEWITPVVCVGIVLWHIFLVKPRWPEDDRPLAKVYYLDDYRDRVR
jgi:hypothetical protein